MFAEIRKKYLEEPLLLPLTVGTVGHSLAQSATHRPQGFHQHHILMVTEGNGIFCAEGKTLCLSKGEGVFFRKEVPHSYWPEGGAFSTCWITFVGGEQLLNYYKVGNCLEFQATPELIRGQQALEAFCCGDSNPLTRSAEGYSWLVRWLYRCFNPTASVETRVRRFLENHFSEDLSLEQVAREVGMSRYALCHYYKKHCHTTVMEQLCAIRIAKAGQMLRLGSASVEEIGRLCGFQSPGYFAKIFKRETGRTPVEYRKGGGAF